MRGSQHETNPYRLVVEAGGLRVARLTREEAAQIGARDRRAAV